MENDKKTFEDYTFQTQSTFQMQEEVYTKHILDASKRLQEHLLS